jgi:putative CocE/NonD family hydrolase
MVLCVLGLALGASLAAGAIVIAAAGFFTDLPGEELTPAGVPRLTSLYVPMRDGVRIAVDVWLPADYAPGQRLPTLMNMTRYWRSAGVGFMGRALTGLGVLDAAEGRRLPSITVPNEDGYVVVRVDGRGSGASFGRRVMEFSPDEIRDYGEVADWIVRQPWSNGRIGAFGVSYEGNTAELIAVNRHPAVKALAPLYGDYDPQFGLIQPGGVRLSYVETWGRAVGWMDRNELCALMDVAGLRCWFSRLVVTGVNAVDGEDGPRLLREAIAEHEGNLDVAAAARAVEFRDDTWGDSGLTIAGRAPLGLADEIEASGLPLWVAVSWLDAATVDGALARFLEFDNPQLLVIGPYSHGGGSDVDPFAPADRAVAPPLDDQYRERHREFFDCYLKEGASCSGIAGKQIRYYTLNEGIWRTTQTWPPPGLSTRRLYLAAAGRLGGQPPEATETADRYTVDFTHSSGSTTRWHTNIGGGDVVYADRAEQDRKLLTYTSDPLDHDLEITGAPIVNLNVASTHADGSFIAYLEDVAPTGAVTYITEGALHALHRQTEPLAPHLAAALGIGRSFLKCDALPMVPGTVAPLRFTLISTSVLLQRGHRIRLAVAGADHGMFLRSPEIGTPVWTVHRSADQPSYIELPAKDR